MRRTRSIALDSGGFRGYFSKLGMPGVAPSTSEIKSATSDDGLTFVMDDGVRIGSGAPNITGSNRQPYALTRPGDCVTLFYYNIESGNTRIRYATGADGLT